MANTVVVGKNVTIVCDGSTDFHLAVSYPDLKEIYLQAVKLKGAAGCSVIVRHGSATGEILSDFADSVGDGHKDMLTIPRWCDPYIKGSEVTASATVILELA